MGMYIGNDEEGFTVYEFLGYDVESKSEYLALEPIAFPSAEVAQGVTTCDQGKSGIKVTELADREQLNEFITTFFEPKNTVRIETDKKAETRMKEYILNQKVNDKSKSYIGNYNFLLNNCGVFVGDVLKAGPVKSPKVFNIPYIANKQMAFTQVKDKVLDVTKKAVIKTIKSLFKK